MSSTIVHTADDLFIEPCSKAKLANREWVRLFVILLACAVDIASLLAASLAATALYGESQTGNSSVFLLLMMWPAYFLASVTYKAYSLEKLQSGVQSSVRADLALLTAMAFAFTTAFALHVSNQFSRLETSYMLVFGAVFLTFSRAFGALWLKTLRHSIEPRTFILGDETALEHAERADQVFDVSRLRWTPSTDPDFLDLVCRTFHQADRVLLVFGDTQHRVAWASFMRLTGINAELLEPQLGSIVPFGIGRWAGAPTLIISRGPLSLPERVMKRVLDLVCTTLFAVVAIPLVVILAVLIKMESPGPFLFVQERVGRRNGRYQCYKLRTMRIAECDPLGSRSASRDDGRVTRIGRFLRKTSLDELPQLWNVLRGDMSLVGPRPHPLHATAEGAFFWQAVQGYWTRHAVRPGLTGLAQVRGLRGATHFRSEIETRVSADLEYINTWSLWLDIKILLRTPFVLMHRNAF